jgi:hypothetical protein
MSTTRLYCPYLLRREAYVLHEAGIQVGPQLAASDDCAHGARVSTSLATVGSEAICRLTPQRFQTRAASVCLNHIAVEDC